MSHRRLTTDFGIAKQMHAAKTNAPAMPSSVMSVEDVTSLVAAKLAIIMPGQLGS
ncbi:hypothetical protein [Pseudomonas syringae]|uniref:hypothetical protein n=1 Tax=Pseudomonas syringae TaxID=317 RepID=UPI001F16EE16|nr:hypothetical protein [Pseudomonas syringae]